MRENQKCNEEIAALKEKLIESDNQKEEIRQCHQDLKQSREEIGSLKEQLESSKAEASRGFPDRIWGFVSGSAKREASLRGDAYKTLEQLVLAIADLEDVGDSLIKGLDVYDKGVRTYAGGRSVGQLVNAARAFSKAWQEIKQKVQPLLDTQESMKELPK